MRTDLNDPSKDGITINVPASVASVKNIASTVHDVGNAAVTGRATYIQNATDEEMVWDEAPSLALMVAPALKWVIWLTLSVLLATKIEVVSDTLGVPGVESTTNTSNSIAPPSAKLSKHELLKRQAAEQVNEAQQHARMIKDHVWMLPVAIFMLALGKLTCMYLRLRAIRYRMSSQRLLIIDSGVLLKVSRPYELHHLSNSVVTSPLLLRLCGCSNLTIGHPGIYLIGLRNAEGVRDLLRTAGQLEAQRIDKIRWR